MKARTAHEPGPILGRHHATQVDVYRWGAIEEPAAIIFDAILVKRVEREPILHAAMQRGVPVVAVWFKTSLDLCLAQNAARPADEIANERGLRNVFAAIEPPSKEEGFARVIEVEPGGA